MEEFCQNEEFWKEEFCENEVDIVAAILDELGKLKDPLENAVNMDGIMDELRLLDPLQLPSYDPSSDPSSDTFMKDKNEHIPGSDLLTGSDRSRSGDVPSTLNQMSRVPPHYNHQQMTHQPQYQSAGTNTTIYQHVSLTGTAHSTILPHATPAAPLYQGEHRGYGYNPSMPHRPNNAQPTPPPQYAPTNPTANDSPTSVPKLICIRYARNALSHGASTNISRD